MAQIERSLIPLGLNLAGKTAIVTGANTGLGYEASRQLILLGLSRLIITVRTKQKGVDTIRALRNDVLVLSLAKPPIIEFYELELDSYRSVQRFCERVHAEVPSLHILLHNAGVNIMGFVLTENGHERVMQINAYSAFIISLSLLPLLQRSARSSEMPSHLTFVGSQLQRLHTLSKDPVSASESITARFDDTKRYNIVRYSDTKLLVAMFVQRLAKEAPATEVVVNNVCPGLVATDGYKTLPFWLRPFLAVHLALFAIPVPDGAKILLHAAVVAGEDSHGVLLVDGKPRL
jgi:NAD(P)-dependent dehydrogenase (short-subunit alcohol dehydrogenase family)